MNEFKNLVAATYAPMKNDQSLNLEVISSYQKFLLKNKVSGAFINGSTGDFASLTVDERKSILDAWYKNKTNDFALINHVGHTSLKVAKELANHSIGKVDAIAALAPYYFKLPNIQSLVNYCAEIASSAPGLPFYYYHIPDLSGADFLMGDFLELAINEIPNLAGIKFTKNNLTDFKYCKEYKNEKYNILFGVDENLINSLPIGASGWVGSTYNHLAPLYYEMITAFQNGDMEKASNLQTKAIQFVNILNGRGGFNGAGKSFMKIIGIDCGPSRFPHTTLNEEELEEIKETLKDLGFANYFSSVDG